MANQVRIERRTSYEACSPANGMCSCSFVRLPRPSGSALRAAERPECQCQAGNEVAGANQVRHRGCWPSAQAAVMGSGRQLAVSLQDCGICGSRLPDHRAHLDAPPAPATGGGALGGREISGGSTQADPTASVQLACKHLFHPLCIRGWTLVGERPRPTRGCTCIPPEIHVLCFAAPHMMQLVGYMLFCARRSSRYPFAYDAGRRLQTILCTSQHGMPVRI